MLALHVFGLQILGRLHQLRRALPRVRIGDHGRDLISRGAKEPLIPIIEHTMRTDARDEYHRGCRLTGTGQGQRNGSVWPCVPATGWHRSKARGEVVNDDGASGLDGLSNGPRSCTGIVAKGQSVQFGGALVILPLARADENRGISLLVQGIQGEQMGGPIR